MPLNSTNSIFDAPLSELHIDARLRGALIRAGFKSLREVSLASEEQLADAIGIELFFDFDDLRERIENDPDAYMLAAAQKRLGECEVKARQALSVLADRADSVIIAESFPRLALELDDIRSGFISLFSHDHFSQGMALQESCDHYPNAFLVFIAHSASEDFDGEAFWNNLFELLKIDTQNIQTDLKYAFYQGVQDRGLPYFTAEEGGYHLFNTALLHGGFSESFWRPMWEDILLPFTKAYEGAWLSRRIAAQLLQQIRNEESHYTLNRAYARRIIEKAPAAMLEPLMESALRVANEVVEAEKYSDSIAPEFGMMSSYGLPDQAMQALRTILENQGTRSPRRIVYLPPGELRIKPGEGVVHLHWDAQKLPTSFAGKVIEYCVNGELMASTEIKMGVGKCILEERDIALKPNERFDVEIAMTEFDDKSTRLDTLNQTFHRTYPGSFEFVQSSDEIFRLRKQSERIKRARVSAFLTMPDLRVVPGLGMTEIEVYDAGEGWKGASIQLFEVEPGSSGTIIDKNSREAVACWQEDYRVEIDRSRIIGKTADKRDLYGFSYGRELGANASLPEIEIEAEDVTRIRDDLEIRCFCDERRVSLPQKVVQDEIDHALTLNGRLLVTLREASSIPKFVVDGIITIVQRSTGQALLNYKFSVVPVRSFGIERIYWENEVLYATYTLEAMDPITIPDEDGDYEMLFEDKYCYDAPLDCDRLRTTVTSGLNGKPLNVELYLAHVSIKIPEEIKAINKVRPICMADVGDVDGRISIISKGGRQSRIVAVMMGYEPLVFKKLSGNTTHSFDIFKDPQRFAFRGAHEEKDVRLSLAFGERTDKGNQTEASAEIVLARCSTGFNLGNANVRWKQNSLRLCFANAAPMDFQVRFADASSGKSLGTEELAEGDDTVLLPPDASYQYDTMKMVAVTIVPISIFGGPDEDMAVRFNLKR